MPLSETMISILKSNKSIMLDKSKRFRKTLGGYGQIDKNTLEFPEASPEFLKSLKERLHKERKQLLWKRGVLFLIAITLAILIFLNL